MLNLALSTEEFIVLCGIVSLAIAIPSQLYFKFKDPSRHRKLPEIPDTIDPYAVAYLRGGTNELIRVLIIHLTIKDFLQVSASLTKPVIFSVSNPPDINKLTSLERKVFNFFVRNGEQSVEKIFVDTGISYFILSFLTDIETQLYYENMLTKKSEFSQADSVILPVSILFAIFVIMQIVNSESGTGWYIFIGISSWLLLISTTRPARVNNLGRRYLVNIQAKFPLQHRPVNIEDENVSVFISSIAIFGFTALENSPFYYFKDVFNTTRHQDGGGCGGGC